MVEELCYDVVRYEVWRDYNTKFFSPRIGCVRLNMVCESRLFTQKALCHPQKASEGNMCERYWCDATFVFELFAKSSDIFVNGPIFWLQRNQSLHVECVQHGNRTASNISEIVIVWLFVQVIQFGWNVFSLCVHWILLCWFSKDKSFPRSKKCRRHWHSVWKS